MSLISSKSLVQRDPAIMAAHIDNELVMMSVDQGEYYGVSGVGTHVWDMLDKPMTVDGICSLIVNEFDVPIDDCRNDVVLFVEEMVRVGLVFLVEIDENSNQTS